MVESFHFQTGVLGGQTQTVYQVDRAADGSKIRSSTVGGRVSYGLTRNLKWLTELGYSRASNSARNLRAARSAGPSRSWPVRAGTDERSVKASAAAIQAPRIVANRVGRDPTFTDLLRPPG